MVSAQIKPQPASTDTYSAPLVLRLPGGWALTDDCIIQLGALNNALWFERTAEGALLISPPPGWDSSEREGIIFAQISDWRFAHDAGRSTAATGGYRLPDSSLLVPDAAWISDERLAEVELLPGKPMPATPDFVLEVRSHSDRLSRQQAKMERWMANGVRLGWLLDVENDCVWVYREGQTEPEQLVHPETLSGESVLEGLTVDLTHVWPHSGG